MHQFLTLFVKGLAMGAANVIPGVSGGTIALISGIYERLINAIKNCDLIAIRYLLRGEMDKFWQRIDGSFLCALLAGVLISIFSLAKILETLLERQEVLTMSFFFGLILLSLYFVGRTVAQWTTTTVLLLLVGAIVASGIAFLAPASENTSIFYLFVCGIVAISSMILPGLSGSFILIIMGNYALVLGAIGGFDLQILLPLAAGCAFGLVAFSHFLAWIFKFYHDQTIALMTGFILGSLFVIWPWKITLTDSIAREGKPVKDVVVGYDWFFPVVSDSHTWIAMGLMILGGVVIWLMETLAGENSR